MHKIKNNPISNDDAVNKKYVDDNTSTKQAKTDNTLDTTDKTVVGAINELNKNFMQSITFKDTNLTITYKNGKVTTVPLNDFISGIIAKANLFSMVVVDALPTVADNGDGTYTITYVQSGEKKTTNNENTWFLYNVKGTYKETMFVGTTEITRDAGSIDLSNYANKLTDVISTWNFTDLTKIPTMASLKNGITDTINSSSTSTDIASAKGVYTELDKKVDKTAITTTINSASTASQVPSAKSVYDNAIKKNGLIWQGTQQLQNSQESSVFNYCKSNFIEQRICGFRLEPKDGSGYFISASVTIIYCLSSVNYGWILGISDKSGTPMAIIQIVEGGTKKWTRICATSVADVPVTDIKFTSTTNYKPSTQIALKYTVSNGICYVSGGIQCVSPNNSYITVCTLPKPKNGWQYCKTFRIDGSRDESSTVMMLINENGELELSMGTATGEYRCTFSYPVKEQ